MIVGNGLCMITEIGWSPRRSLRSPAARIRRPVLALLVTGLFNVWLSGQCIRTGYRVSSALEEKRTLQKEQEVLRLEALALKAPPASTPSPGTTCMVPAQMDRVIR